MVRYLEQQDAKRKRHGGHAKCSDIVVSSCERRGLIDAASLERVWLERVWLERVWLESARLTQTHA